MWRTATAASMALLGSPILREPSFGVTYAKLEVSEEAGDVLSIRQMEHKEQWSNPQFLMN